MELCIVSCNVFIHRDLYWTLYSCIDFDSRVLSKAFVQEINTENYATSSIPGTVSANVHMKYMVQIYLTQSCFMDWVVWERQKFSPVSWRSSPKRPCHVAPRAHSRFQPVPSLQAGRTQSWPSFPAVPALCTPQISLGQSWSVGMFMQGQPRKEQHHQHPYPLILK